MLYIVAGNKNEYRDWVIGQKTIHVSETRYVSNADQLRGMSSIEGLFIGTCFDRPDISQIVNHINVIRSRTAKPIIKMESLFHLSRHHPAPQVSHDKTMAEYLRWITKKSNINIWSTTSSYNEYCGADMRGTTFDRFIADEIKNT